jgi:hypothetical protein
MAEHDRLAFAPVLVEDVDAVFRRYYAAGHGLAFLADRISRKELGRSTAAATIPASNIIEVFRAPTDLLVGFPPRDQHRICGAEGN